jgi:protein-tyrosine phosphatase
MIFSENHAQVLGTGYSEPPDPCHLSAAANRLQSARMPDLARHLNLAGASNFRDIGGYPTSDGRTVRWRQIFRSNHLGNLTDGDIAVLRDLGVKSAFDFRGTQERLAAMCVHDDITVHSLPVEPITVATLRQRMAGGKALSPADARDVMRHSYRNYVTHNTKAYRALFAHLLEDRAPLVIHCTAGKDRTGFASALILHALGVSKDVIDEDYLLTNHYYRRDPATASTDLPEDVRAVLATVEDSFLAAAFEAVQSGYGGVDSYLSDGLGVGARERATLQARYLDS